MKVSLNSLTTKGLLLSFRDEAMSSLLNEIFKNENLQLDSISGEMIFQKFDQHLRLKGKLDLDLKPSCDLCLSEFFYHFRDDFEIDFSPLYDSKKDQDRNAENSDEIELHANDLNFVFYEGDSINLDPILSDQLILNLPSSFKCTENCKGLCQNCGENLNISSCTCDSLDKIDPRWHALMQLKKNK